MSLLEVVVMVTVIGAIATVLAAAVTVTFRQEGGTRSGLDVARWEQALALWLPTDLASADPASIDPNSPSSAIGSAGCIADCATTSNVLTLSFDDGSGTTTVSYRYGPTDDGESYALIRVECSSGVCTSRQVLGDLAAPPAGWSPPDPAPSDVVSVSAPTVVVEGGDTSIDVGAVTVSVLVNSDDDDGAGRSSLVSVTAGGVALGDLDPPSLEGPSFVEARSGCGGPVTLLVDRSGSIGSDMETVREGVESFVRTLEGTPTQLQIIGFQSRASLVGSGRTHYFDLAEPSDVTLLAGDPADPNDGLIGGLTSGGGTNWQEPLIRTFFADDSATISYADDGDPDTMLPGLVVMFTDGYPDRPVLDEGDGSITGVPAAAAIPEEHYRHRDDGRGDLTVTPIGWWRADYIVNMFRSSVRFIGVGVGPTFEAGESVSYPEWPADPIPGRIWLGTLINGISDPAAYNGVDESFNMVEFAGGWGDVSEADILVSDDLSQLGSGLAAIALAECGGTLTVQTRDASGAQFDEDVTFQLGAEQVTTGRFVKTGTFDVPFGGSPSATIDVTPSSIDGSGHSVTGWRCSSRGVDLVMGVDFDLRTAGVPADGITVTVTPNAAVSCTLEVS